MILSLFITYAYFCLEPTLGTLETFYFKIIVINNGENIACISYKNYKAVTLS